MLLLRASNWNPCRRYVNDSTIITRQAAILTTRQPSPYVRSIDRNGVCSPRCTTTWAIGFAINLLSVNVSRDKERPRAARVPLVYPSAPIKSRHRHDPSVKQLGTREISRFPYYYTGARADIVRFSPFEYICTG